MVDSRSTHAIEQPRVRCIRASEFRLCISILHTNRSDRKLYIFLSERYITTDIIKQSQLDKRRCRNNLRKNTGSNLSEIVISLVKSG